MSAGDDEVIPLHAPFEITFRGFRQQQVLEYIESLEGEISLISTDRDRALEQAADLRKLLDHLRQEWEEARRRLESKPPTPPTGLPAGVTSERLHQMVVLAEAEAKSIREKGEAEALATRAEAQRRIDEAFETLAEDRAALEQRGREFEAEMRAEREKAAADGRAIIAKAEAEGDKLQKQAVAKCARLEAESEARRSCADQDHERKLARRLDEAAKELLDMERRHGQKISTLLSLVAWETDRRLSAIERERADLLALQGRLSTQLSDAHEALGMAVELVGTKQTETKAAQAVEAAKTAEIAEARAEQAAKTAQVRAEDAASAEQDAAVDSDAPQQTSPARNGSGPSTGTEAKPSAWAVAGGS